MPSVGAVANRPKPGENPAPRTASGRNGVAMSFVPQPVKSPVSKLPFTINCCGGAAGAAGARTAITTAHASATPAKYFLIAHLQVSPAQTRSTGRELRQANTESRQEAIGSLAAQRPPDSLPGIVRRRSGVNLSAAQ